MAYIDAHNAKLRLAEDLTNPRYDTYLQGMARSMTRQSRGQERYTSTVEVLTETVRSAETFTISYPMWQLVQASTADMPNTELRPEELPSRNGFLWLPDPMMWTDLHGRHLYTHVIVWHTQGNGVVVDMFTDRDDPRDEVNQWLVRRGQQDPATLAQIQGTGKYMLAHSMLLDFYRPVPPSPNCEPIRALSEQFDLDMPEHWVSQYQVYEQEFVSDEGTVAVEFVPVLNEDATLSEEQFNAIQDAYRELGTNPENYEDANPVQQLVCFWRMCQQTLAAREYAHPDRHLAKRMVKRQFATSPVTVITLRRRASKEHLEGRLVEWDHRWLRRGHWRRQWYGSGENKHQKSIYINPQICGPEDKPLLIRPHVNLLAR